MKQFEDLLLASHQRGFQPITERLANAVWTTFLIVKERGEMVIFSDVQSNISVGFSGEVPRWWGELGTSKAARQTHHWSFLWKDELFLRRTIYWITKVWTKRPKRPVHNPSRPLWELRRAKRFKGILFSSGLHSNHETLIFDAKTKS